MEPVSVRGTRRSFPFLADVVEHVRCPPTLCSSCRVQTVAAHAQKATCATSSSVEKKDRDCGDNAQRDEDEQRDPHANREAVDKRGLTGWDGHEPREPFVEFHSMPSFRIRRTLCRARIC
jgi:hypothetical protein